MDYTEAWRHDTTAETLWENSATDVCILAPHGGDIEYGTDDCAARIHKALSNEGIQPTTWMYHAWGDDAFEEHHVSANRIRFTQFDKLRQLDGRSFEYAVSIHMQNEDYNAVGGQVPADIRRDVVERLQEKIPEKEHRYRHDQMKYTGAKDSNLVNRITDNGSNGLQLELTPRTAYIYTGKESLLPSAPSSATSSVRADVGSIDPIERLEGDTNGVLNSENCALEYSFYIHTPPEFVRSERNQREAIKQSGKWDL